MLRKRYCLQATNLRLRVLVVGYSSALSSLVGRFLTIALIDVRLPKTSRQRYHRRQTFGKHDVCWLPALYLYSDRWKHVLSSGKCILSTKPPAYPNGSGGETDVSYRAWFPRKEDWVNNHQPVFETVLNEPAKVQLVGSTLLPRVWPHRPRTVFRDNSQALTTVQRATMGLSIHILLLVSQSFLGAAK